MFFKAHNLMDVRSRSDDGADSQSKELHHDLWKLPCVRACSIGIDENFTSRSVGNVISGLFSVCLFEPQLRELLKRVWT